MASFGKKNDKFLSCINWIQASEAIVNIGTNGFDSFSCDLTSEYPMISYQYDCEYNAIPSCQTNVGFDQFTSACLASKTNKVKLRTYYSLEDIVKRHNLTGKHLNLKIDIKGAEW